MKVIIFAATSHRESINKQLVEYAGRLLSKASVEVLDLNDYELPLYSQDRENKLGHPKLAKDFLSKISKSLAATLPL